MEYIKRLWKRCKKRLEGIVYKIPKEDDYFVLEDPNESLLSVMRQGNSLTQTVVTRDPMRYASPKVEVNERNINALEKVIQMALMNQVDACVQTDICLENGYVIYRYDLEKYIENERKTIEKNVILMFENKMLENISQSTFNEENE